MFKSIRHQLQHCEKKKKRWYCPLLNLSFLIWKKCANEWFNNNYISRFTSVKPNESIHCVGASNKEHHVTSDVEASSITAASESTLLGFTVL